MSFSSYTIRPQTLTLIGDGVAFYPVAMTGIPANVNAIQWDGTAQKGTIEYLPDPFTGILPAPGTFPTYGTYSIQLTAIENPLVVYAVNDGATYLGKQYLAAQKLDIYEYPNPAVPAGFTTSVPDYVVGVIPDVDPYQIRSQWNGAQWIDAAFPYTYTLAEAQGYLSAAVNTQRVGYIDNQLRVYTTPEIIAAPDPDALVPADSVFNGYTTMGAYNAAVNALANAKLSTINAAVNIADLYGFDPKLPAPPDI